jgi:hypothetical protein
VVRTPAPLRPALLAGLAGLALACAQPPPPPAAELAPERRVPLARLVVENRTAYPMTVSLRYALDPSGEIVVGRVDSGGVVEMAPVPAAEPVLLLARGNGLRARSGPHTFQIDEVWTWRITPHVLEEDRQEEGRDGG